MMDAVEPITRVGASAIGDPTGATREKTERMPVAYIPQTSAHATVFNAVVCGVARASENFGRDGVRPPPARPATTLIPMYGPGERTWTPAYGTVQSLTS